MTVKELKKLIKNVPDHMDVLVHIVDAHENLHYIDSGSIKTIPFREEPTGEDLCEGDVYILNIKDQF